MKTSLISLLMITTIVSTNVEQITEPQWEMIGECRITTYCPHCNEPQGHQSSSGKYLEYGDCACNFLPLGTVISIEGEEFTVVDTCGMDNTIDIFIDSDSCQCNLLDYRKVSVKSD